MRHGRLGHWSAGLSGLAALAQDVLGQKLADGAAFAFQGRRGDGLKLPYWDCQCVDFITEMTRYGVTPLDCTTGGWRSGTPRG